MQGNPPVRANDQSPLDRKYENFRKKRKEKERRGQKGRADEKTGEERRQ